MEHKRSLSRWLFDIGLLLFAFTFALDLIALSRPPIEAQWWIRLSSFTPFFFFPTIGILLMLLAFVLRFKRRQRAV